MKKQLVILGIVLTLVLAMIAIVPTSTAHTEEEPQIVTLYAGKDIDVGTVSVWNDGENIHVEYETTGDWYITETHLYIGKNVPPTSAPGQFPYSMPHEPEVDYYKYTIALDEIYAYKMQTNKKGKSTGVMITDGTPGVNVDETVYIAAHAVVIHITDGSIDFYSDTTTTYKSYPVGPIGNNAVLAWVHPNWISDLDHTFTDAEWIWESYRVNNSVDGDIVDFYKTVNIPGLYLLDASGIIYITCDNGYELYLNNYYLGSAQLGFLWRASDLTESYVNSNGWQSVEDYDISEHIKCGENRFWIPTANEQMDGGTVDSNPAGLIFEGEICYKVVDQEETAWGDGTNFGTNWAMYFTYIIQEECEPVLLDTVEVTPYGTDPYIYNPTCSIYLPAGNYRLVASGTYRFANWGGTYGTADALCNKRTSAYASGTPVGDDWYILDSNRLQVFIFGAAVDWLSVTHGTRTLDPNHTYSYEFCHTGGMIEFGIEDNVYGDNSGFIKVEIWGCPVP